MKRLVKLLCIAALLAAGCAPPAAGGSGTVDRCAGGKCDSNASVGVQFEADLAAIAQEGGWSEGPLDTVEDAFSAQVETGAQRFAAATHVIDRNQPVTIIPYADKGDASLTFSDGETPVLAAFEHIDAPLSAHYPPGEIGWAIKHHRMEHRIFDMNELGGPASSIKEHAKNQDTHIELVIGVDNAGRAGIEGGDPDANAVVTINSPQGYEGGRFDGSRTYPMIFVKPRYPDFLTQDQQRAFRDNIRTMMVAFSAVADFPGEYNGGDPLGAHSPAKVRELVARMVTAIAGDEAEAAEARAWFGETENLIYCAELAHVSASAGLIVPLNETAITGVLAEQGMAAAHARNVWARFVDLMGRHNAGESTPFVELNANKRVAAIEMTEAPASLRAAAAYAPEPENYRDQLAFRPMTAGDLILTFLRTHVPRGERGEGFAVVQARALEAMKNGLLENMDMGRLVGALRRIPQAEPLADRLEELRQGPARAEDLALIETGIEQLRDVAPTELVSGLEGRLGVEKAFRAVLAFVATNWDTCEPVPEYDAYVRGMPEDQSPIGICNQMHPGDDTEGFFRNLLQRVGAWARGIDLPETGYGRLLVALEGFGDNKGVLQRIREEMTAGDPAGKLFVPPATLHLTAMGAWPSVDEIAGERQVHALLGLDYVGHGLHYNYVTAPSGLELSPIADARDKTIHFDGEEVASGTVRFGESASYPITRVPLATDLVLLELNTARGDANLVVTKFGETVCESTRTGLQQDTCLLPALDEGSYDVTVKGAGAEESGEPGSDAMPNEFSLTGTAIYAAEMPPVDIETGDVGIEEFRDILAGNLPENTKYIEFWAMSGSEQDDYGTADLRVYAMNDSYRLGEEGFDFDEWLDAQTPRCDEHIDNGGIGFCSVKHDSRYGYVVLFGAEAHTGAMVRAVAK